MFLSVWDRESLHFYTKGIQLWWQKMLILHSLPPQTFFFSLASTTTLTHKHTNTFTKTYKQWILSVLINSYIFQAADVAARGRSEREGEEEPAEQYKIKLNADWSLRCSQTRETYVEGNSKCMDAAYDNISGVFIWKKLVWHQPFQKKNQPFQKKDYTRTTTTDVVVGDLLCFCTFYDLSPVL